MKKEILYIGYIYETNEGEKVYKIVLCDGQKEYDDMKELIEDSGMEVIEFAQVMIAKHHLR